MGHCDRCVTMSTNLKTVMLTIFKGISDNQSRLHPLLARTGAVLPIWMQSKVKFKKWLHHIAPFRVESGVEAESELESESVFSGRSRSRLNFIDPAALNDTMLNLVVPAAPRVIWLLLRAAI